VTTTQLNALVVGPDDAVRALVSGLRERVAAPVIEVHPAAAVTLPEAAAVGTLICYDVANLGLDQQRRLIEWLDQAAGRTRIISTASIPILPLVEQRQFDDALYYRLNTIYVELPASP
jgi:transcriptional regulator of aromatic amino acid metabolism